jgi:hypothetical protein
MNGLTTGEEHLKLIAVIFQNLVPPINVNTVRFSVTLGFMLLFILRFSLPSLLLSLSLMFT